MTFALINILACLRLIMIKIMTYHKHQSAKIPVHQVWLPQSKGKLLTDFMTISSLTGDTDAHKIADFPHQIVSIKLQHNNKTFPHCIHRHSSDMYCLKV